MKITILDKKTISGDKNWYLVRASLSDYLESLRDDFSNYEIQRRIVKNTYLDKLSDTILKNEPMSIITLTGRAVVKDDELDVEHCEILDGLQRTYRLWSVLHISKFAKENNVSDPRTIYKLLKEDDDGKQIIDSHVINSRHIRELFDTTGGRSMIDPLISKYTEYDVYLSIWENLDDNEVVQKMLVLNAGQKSVSSTHQYELLFLHFFNNLDLPNGIQIIREKDKIYNTVKSKSRIKEQILLSSVIIALQSFIEKKPLRINQVNDVNMDESDITGNNVAYFSKDLLSKFILLIYQLGKNVDRNDELLRWVGKDTTLSGLFAALGSVITSETPKETLLEAEKYIKTIDANLINLPEFKQAYDDLSSTSVNVGNAVRKAVFIYFKEQFNRGNSNWSDSFNTSKS
jgi:hypothetical protein